jgi:aminoglycoside phosphotransferase (APT) family kinase protein
VVTEIRINPLIEVRPNALAALVGGEIANIERITGGLTNTIHRVERTNGDVLAVKHYADRDGFDTELVTLTLLHTTLPVPHIVHVDDDRRALVYRWIEGVTLNEYRRTIGAIDHFAEPLGSILAWLARTDATESYELSPILASAHRQLASGRARERLGGDLADAMRRTFDRYEQRMAWGAVCLVHGDFSGRNVLVEDQTITGVIDWEATTTGSPLADIGSLFRYGTRYDDGFRAAFARAYCGAGGDLPDDWFLTARVLDATWLVDTLDETRDLDAVFADCRSLIAALTDEVAT